MEEPKFKPKPLEVGTKYLVLIKKTPFFPDEYGQYKQGKSTSKIVVEEKKPPKELIGTPKSSL